MLTLTWKFAFLKLWQAAIASRGLAIGVTADADTADDLNAGWPRTRGSDALAIASVIDPVMRSLPPEEGNDRIQRRWRTCASALADRAVTAPGADYPDNRALWLTLAAVTEHLARRGVPVPGALWDALLAEIAEPDDDPPPEDDYLQINAPSYAEMWLAQDIVLSRLRGTDEVDSPADVGGAWKRVPRTTNGDVVQLISYWNAAVFRAARVRPRFDDMIVIGDGLDGALLRWHTAVRDVDGIAENGDPADRYTKNGELWQASLSLAVVLAQLGDPPLGFELAITPAAPQTRNARGITRNGEPSFVAQWTAQREAQAKLRGSDPDAATGSSQSALDVPRSTNADVVELAKRWRAATAKVAGVRGIRDDFGAAWAQVIANVDQIAKVGKPDEIYAKRAEFWRASRALATSLDGLQAPLARKPDGSAPDFLSSMAKGLSRAVQTVTDEVRRSVGGLGEALSKAERDAGKHAGEGFLSSLKTPLLIGGSVLGGLLLARLFRGTEHPKEA